MSANEYQLVKCEGCGKTLGYIYVKLKSSFSAFYFPRYVPLMGQTPPDFEKTAFCETCFQKRVEKVTGIKQEPEVTKESAETRPKSRDRSLIR